MFETVHYTNPHLLSFRKHRYAVHRTCWDLSLTPGRCKCTQDNLGFNCVDCCIERSHMAPWFGVLFTDSLSGNRVWCWCWWWCRFQTSWSASRQHAFLISWMKTTWCSLLMLWWMPSGCSELVSTSVSSQKVLFTGKLCTYRHLRSY